MTHHPPTEIPAEVDVLVVGAGPTGLAAAAEAARFGLSVCIVDGKPHRSTYSKALVVHARTMEAFETMGVADAVRAAGVPFAAMRLLQGQGAAPVTLDLMSLDWGDTRYPYWLSVPQYETERCLEEHLAAQGVPVRWSTAFVSLDRREDHVSATLQPAEGDAVVIRAKWLLGCDGGRSPVREQAALAFDQERIGETFVIADALGDTPHPEDHGTTSLAEDGVLFLVPMPEPRRWRIIAHVPDHPEGEPLGIDAAFVDRLIERRLGFRFGASDLSWTSQFVLRQGVARSYRAGRVFIAGDAAHLHSPVGGQGLNTGVQDAHALLWRIALAERGAPDRENLLDSYEVERRAVASAMVKNTTRATRVVTVHRGLVATLRRVVAGQAIKLRRVQNQLGRGVGMLDLAYPESQIAGAGAGVGARLPNPEDGAGRLHDRLHRKRFSALLFEQGELAASLRAQGVHVVELSREVAGALGAVGLVLVRPDRVVAMAAREGAGEALAKYAREVVGVPLAQL